MSLGTKQMIRSVPKELNTDQSTVLEAIQVLGYVSVSMLQHNICGSVLVQSLSSMIS